jgi:hypothetical protein
MPVVVVFVIESVVVIVMLSPVIIAAPESGIGVGAGVTTSVVVAVVVSDALSSLEHAPSTSSDDAARTVKNERFIPTSDEGPKKK